jgi:hypothetical protein
MKNLISEQWLDRKWRPMMGWTYMAICIFDFIIFPVLWSAFQAQYSGTVNDQYDPITLQGGGLLHVAFGAILGVTSWSRGKEKIAYMETSNNQINTQNLYNHHQEGSEYNNGKN